MLFRTLRAGDGIKVQQRTEDVTISAEIDGENISGEGSGIFNQLETRNGVKLLRFNRIIAGQGIEITEQNGAIVISAVPVG